MKGCSLAWNIDPNGITILHQRESDGVKEMEGGWGRDDEGSGHRGEQIDRGRNLVCPCHFSLIFFFSPRPCNDFRTGTIKHHSGNQRRRKKLKYWALGCFSSPPPSRSFGTVVVLPMLQQRDGCCSCPGSCKQKRVQAECRGDKVKVFPKTEARVI